MRYFNDKYLIILSSSQNLRSFCLDRNVVKHSANHLQDNHHIHLSLFLLTFSLENLLLIEYTLWDMWNDVWFVRYRLLLLLSSPWKIWGESRKISSHTYFALRPGDTFRQTTGILKATFSQGGYSVPLRFDGCMQFTLWSLSLTTVIKLCVIYPKGDNKLVLWAIKLFINAANYMTR